MEPMKIFPAKRCLILFLLLFSSLAHALAGFAERSSTFHYNDFSQIERGHPSDLCYGLDNGQWCLVLRRDDYRHFKDIDSPFAELNVPVDTSTPYIIGRRSSDNHWLVYELEKEILLISDADYRLVLDVWQGLGMEEPIYVNARNTRELSATVPRTGP